METALWHFTCGHSYKSIGDEGLLYPHPHPLMPELGSLIWLTDDAEPDRDDVGLTMGFITCDRMEYRYAVRSAPSCKPWSSVRDALDTDVLTDLESFGAPETWWVSSLPLRAVLSPYGEPK